MINRPARPLTIAFIGARGIPHSYASAEQLVRNVGPRLAARGHAVTVYCYRHHFHDRSEFYQGVRRRFLPTIDHRIFGQLVHGQLSAMDAAFGGYDVIHFQALTNALQSLTPWLLRRRVVVNVNGQEWENPKWPWAARQIFFRLAARAALLSSAEIVTDAAGMCEIYERRYRRESTQIAYGADVVTSRDPSVVRQYGLESKEYYFVAARLVPSNSADVLVDGFNRSRSRRLLAIAGGQSFNSEWSRQLEARAGDRVRFLGPIANQDHVNELYCNAYAYLHGATLGGINSALLRPLGCGIPAVSIDTPFNREVIEMEDGTHCGLIVPREAEAVARGIDRMEEDADLVRVLGERARQRILEAFTWDRIALQYETLYQGLVDGTPLPELRRRVHRSGMADGASRFSGGGKEPS